MFKRNRNVEINDNEILWRYMSYSKFQDLLTTSSLYFSRIDCFEDKLEATMPNGSHDFARRTENPWQAFELYNVEEQLRILGTTVFANCWHINDSENPDMWKNYVTTQGNEGIAIKTTFENLSKCFKTNRTLTNVRMKYIDYKTEYADYFFPNYIDLLSLKDNKFINENELRIITIEDDYYEYDPDSDENIKEVYPHKGEHINVDLHMLINEIYLCPESTPRFKHVVEVLLKTYAINVPINKSELKTKI